MNKHLQEHPPKKKSNLDTKPIDEKHRENVPLKGVSDLRVRIWTPNDKKVQNERVIVVLPDGTATSKQTGSDGCAIFPNLQFPPKSVCYVVLPDVLEAWSPAYTDQSKHSAGAATGTLRQVYMLKVGKKQRGAAERIADKCGERDALLKRRALDKDAIDKLIGTSSKPYRAGDFSKYCVNTQAEGSEKTFEVVLDRLTAEEKMSHFVWAFTKYPISYSRSSKVYWYKTDKLRPRWYSGSTAYCNGFVNLFLGFWLNYNTAFERDGSNFTFLQIMENPSERVTVSGEGRYRGYSELWSTLLHPTAAEGTTTESALLVKGNDKVARKYKYIDAAKDEAKGWWNNSKHKPLGSMAAQFGYVNVYSVWQASGGVDSHGGIFCSRPDGLFKLAADSDSVRVMQAEDRVNRRGAPYRLRIWRMRELAPGGACPVLQGNQYLNESALSAHTAAIVDYLPNAISRFIERG